MKSKTKKSAKKPAVKWVARVGAAARMKPPKEILKVTPQVLERLADRIYGDGKYLRLCAGTLQNGPDPDDKERSMHCGLGELWYAVTGRQPEEGAASGHSVSEPMVCRMVVERAGLNWADGHVGSRLFHKLYSIYPENDAATGFRSRARSVANKLREAAEILREGKAEASK